MQPEDSHHENKKLSESDIWHSLATKHSLVPLMSSSSRLLSVGSATMRGKDICTRHSCYCHHNQVLSAATL